MSVLTFSGGQTVRKWPLIYIAPVALIMTMFTPTFQNGIWRYDLLATAQIAPSQIEGVLRNIAPTLLPHDERPPPDPDQLDLPQSTAESTDPELSDRYSAAIKVAATQFKGERLVMALAVNRAESGLRPSVVAYNCSPQPCERGSRDRGYWQINDHWHPEVSDKCALDPVCNAKEAARISNAGKDWGAWSSYWEDPVERTGPGLGVFLQYVPEVRAALAHYGSS